MKIYSILNENTNKYVLYFSCEVNSLYVITSKPKEKIKEFKKAGFKLLHVTFWNGTDFVKQNLKFENAKLKGRYVRIANEDWHLQRALDKCNLHIYV